MASFDQVEEVHASTQFGNTGPAGWGFTLWGSASCAQEVHRNLLERLAETHPRVSLNLPPWFDREDLAQGSLTWEDAPVYVRFRNGLESLLVMVR